MRYSLFSVMLAVGLAAIACGFVGADLRATAEQRKVVDQLRLNAEWRTCGWSVHVVKISAVPTSLQIPGQPAHKLTDSDIDSLKVFRELESLTLVGQFAGVNGSNGGAEVTDRAMSALLRLRNLRHLELDSIEISDAGLETIATMPRLQSLHIFRTRITAAGIASFKQRRPHVTLVF